jgi:hypothetical protein
MREPIGKPVEQTIGSPIEEQIIKAATKHRITEAGLPNTE